MEFRENRILQLQRGKKNLVITLGDSWTFGDSLGSIALDHTKDDYEARITQAYGRHLADSLDADWFNFGICGGGNISFLSLASDFAVGHHILFLRQENYTKIRDTTWPESVIDGLNILDIQNELKTVHCKNIMPIDVTKYKNVYMFVTLTETGRDFEAFKKLGYTISSDVIDYVKAEEELVYNIIAYIKKHSNYPIIIGRNFTIDLPTTKNSQLDVDKIWIEINHQYNAQFANNKNIKLEEILQSGPISGIGLTCLNQPESFHNYKKYFVDQVNRADKCWEWLRNNPLNHNHATCHPTKESHKLWADYLLSAVK